MKYVPAILLSALLLTSVAVLSNAVFAQEYTYVSRDGDLKQIEADTANEAIVEADDRATHSGVIEGNLDGNFTPSGNGNMNSYLYVDMNGELQAELAPTPNMAIQQADNIHPNSGVIRAQVEEVK